jgi:hypothetical protein
MLKSFDFYRFRFLGGETLLELPEIMQKISVCALACI